MTLACALPATLLDLPCYVINLERNTRRLEDTLCRLCEVGFTNVTRFPGIDGRNSMQLRKAWQQFSPEFFASATPAFKHSRGNQGCYLSHITLWKKISDEGIPAAIIFEDDVLFHEKWIELYTHYWRQTPKDFDTVYMGSDIVNAKPYADVICCPVVCNHATIISCTGATKLYDYATNQRPAPLDFVVYAWQKRLIAGGNKDILRWYVWSERTNMPLPGINNSHVGLVYQDRTFVSENY